MRLNSSTIGILSSIAAVAIPAAAQAHGGAGDVPHWHAEAVLVPLLIAVGMAAAATRRLRQRIRETSRRR